MCRLAFRADAPGVPFRRNDRVLELLEPRQVERVRFSSGENGGRSVREDDPKGFAIQGPKLTRELRERTTHSQASKLIREEVSRAYGKSMKETLTEYLASGKVKPRSGGVARLQDSAIRVQNEKLSLSSPRSNSSSSAHRC